MEKAVLCDKMCGRGIHFESKTTFNYNCNNDLLVLQVSPVHPTAHVQLKSLTRSTQVPPLRQGELAQSLRSKSIRFF